MATKNRYDQIQACEQEIADAEQRIQAESAKITAAQARIRKERKRIQTMNDEISRHQAALLAEKFRSSNLTLEDALAALELQSDQRSDAAGEEAKA